MYFNIKCIGKLSGTTNEFERYLVFETGEFERPKFDCMWHTKMHFSTKCNSGCIAIQWFHIKHYLDYQYTKFQQYTIRVQIVCFCTIGNFGSPTIITTWQNKISLCNENISCAIFDGHLSLLNGICHMLNRI